MTDQRQPGDQPAILRHVGEKRPGQIIAAHLVLQRRMPVGKPFLRLTGEAEKRHRVRPVKLVILAAKLPDIERSKITVTLRGAGLDLFRFAAFADALPGADVDQITDFFRGQDRLDFSAIDTSPDPDRQGFAFIDSAAFFAAGTEENRFVSPGTGFGVQADLDGDGVADMAVLLTTGNGALTAADFLL
jgi:hypothetical protein